MPSFSSGYKAEYVALINEVESKMKGFPKFYEFIVHQLSLFVLQMG